MSGLVSVSQDATWMPAGWILDNVLEDIAAEVVAEDSKLAGLLLDGRTERGGYCDLQALDPQAFGRLLRAAERVCARALKRGGAAFQDPSYFDGFAQQLLALVKLLRGDPRASASAP